MIGADADRKDALSLERERFKDELMEQMQGVPRYFFEYISRGGLENFFEWAWDQHLNEITPKWSRPGAAKYLELVSRVERLEKEIKWIVELIFPTPGASANELTG
jgi:hypothetical protein